MHGIRDIRASCDTSEGVSREEIIMSRLNSRVIGCDCMDRRRLRNGDPIHESTMLVHDRAHFV
jgi:hypothetical protein